MGWLRERIFRLGAAYLTKPLALYPQRAVLDPEILRQTLRKGDIILVEGDQRVSEVIKFLTQSSWSHAALYVGDAFSARSDEDAAELETRYGPDTSHLLVEALLEGGVTMSPLAKYAGYNIRICRPTGLHADDLQRVLDETMSQLGTRYDMRHVIELARYFFPVNLLPRRFRRTALEAASTLTHDVICSSLIALAFQNVGFPILPSVVAGETAPALPVRWGRRRRGTPYPGVFRHKRTNLITPRDFDLSPYFEIVKVNLERPEPFDYQRIRWQE
ncbi:MAG: YiiX/YebB-like N1pC/P60 family cysteine hydrolase [Deltaproteobacteria bacterium]